MSIASANTREQAKVLYAEIIAAEDQKAIKDLCLTDLFFLLTVGCKRQDADHDWIYDRCREVEANPDGHLDLWSREFFKSSIITFGKTLQDILNNPNITVGIFSHTRPIAKAFLAQLKREMEINTFLQGLFPEILYKEPKSQAPKWSLDSGIVVKRDSNKKECTIEAWGLVDGSPTSKHFDLLVYDDVVTKASVNTPEQIAKTTEAWELSLNLGAQGGKRRYIGTRYHACLPSSTKIMNGDWSHKDIKDVKIGDFVIGWELRNGSRYLVKTKVLNIGMYKNQDVFNYKLDNGETITCTPTHKWWRGPRGGGLEYANIGLNYHDMKSIRKLTTLFNKVESQDAGYLSGFYDADGTFRKNTHHKSGSIHYVQSMHYDGIFIKEIESRLTKLGFEYSKTWRKDANPKHKDVCCINICGGWRARYKFLRELDPIKSKQIHDSLFSQLHTKKVNLLSKTKGNCDVFWIETETGNYIANGYCSKNSDTYKTMIDRGSVVPRIYPARVGGKIDGKAVFMSEELLQEKRRDMGPFTFSAQMLQNPTADKAMGFKKEWLKFYQTKPTLDEMNIYILVDPASTKKKTSDYTVMEVIGLAPDQNYYLIDAIRDRLSLTERAAKLFEFHRKYRPLKVGYEKYGMQADIEHCKYEMEHQNYRFSITELGGKVGKVDRILCLVPPFEQGRMWMPKTLPVINYEGKHLDYVEMFINDEYDAFPVPMHDDMLDCRARIMDPGLGAQFPEEKKPEPEVMFQQGGWIG